MPQLQVPGAARLWAEQQKTYMRKHNQDMWVPFTGPTGSGKSNLMLLLAPYIDPTFYQTDLKYRMAWRGNVFQEILDELGPWKLAILDEGGRAFWKRRAMHGENQEAVLGTLEDRKFNAAKFVGFPVWEKMDDTFKDNAPDYRWECAPPPSFDATLKKAARNKSGTIVGWKTIVTFRPPNLEQLRPNLWRYYEALAKAHTRRGEQSEGQQLGSTGEQLPLAVRLAGDYQDLARSMVTRWTPADASKLS